MLLFHPRYQRHYVQCLLLLGALPWHLQGWLMPSVRQRSCARASTLTKISTEFEKSAFEDDFDDEILNFRRKPNRYADGRFVVPDTPPRSHPHLFRHYDDISFDSWLRCDDPKEFWASVGYNPDDLPPDLREAPVHEQIAPHVRFLAEVLHAGTGRLLWAEGHYDSMSAEGSEKPVPHSLRLSETAIRSVPHSFYRCSIERTLAPWHAYLQFHGLINGPELFQDISKFTLFCETCASSKIASFVELCRSWSSTDRDIHTVDRVQTFCRAFRRGVLPAARNAKSKELEAIGCTPAQMMKLLVSHGANFLQKDKYGVDMLHWAAGTGHLEAVQILLAALIEERYPHETQDESIGGTAVIEATDAKDGATPLHWACAGVSRNGFGVGGSVEECNWLLQQAGSKRKELSNAATWSGSTPVMWAAWSGSLDIVIMLLDAGADLNKLNRRKQSAAHWAAAAGHLQVCEFLYQKMGASFFDKEDSTGQTPLQYAKMFNRRSTADWLYMVLLKECGAQAVRDVLDSKRPTEPDNSLRP